MNDQKIKLASNNLTSIDEQNFTVKAIISDETEDRHGEVVVQDGWDFTEYKSNPIVLFGHDAGALPIGKTLDIEIVDGKTVATMQFAVNEYDRAKDIWNLVKGGYLKTISVGFINVLRDGAKLLENKLLEISVVPVPANPNAITLAAETGVINKKDVTWLRDTMTKEVEALTSHIEKDDNKSEDESMDNKELTEKLDTLTEAVTKLAEQITTVLDKVEIKPEDKPTEDDPKVSDDGSQAEPDDKDEPNEDSSGADGVDADDETLTDDEAEMVTQAVVDALADDVKPQLDQE